MELMLLDSAFIQEKDAEWENKWRARKGKPAIRPLYTTADAEQALSQRQPLLYGESREVAKGVQVTFHNAGHILGSSIVEIEVQDHHLTRRLVFSGYLGNN
jgi:metallo-beta-lactamase family protein